MSKFEFIDDVSSIANDLTAAPARYDDLRDAIKGLAIGKGLGVPSDYWSEKGVELPDPKDPKDISAWAQRRRAAVRKLINDIGEVGGGKVFRARVASRPDMSIVVIREANADQSDEADEAEKADDSGAATNEEAKPAPEASDKAGASK